MAKLFSTGLQYVIFSAILSLILVSFVSCQNVDKKICQTEGCLFAAQNLKESINVTANPCDDFYLYACGNYPMFHTKSYAFSPRLEENEKEINDFIKQNNSDDEPEAVHKARKLYSLCLNEAAYSSDRAAVDKILQKIGLPVRSSLSNETEVKDFDFASALARAARFAGVKLYLDVGVIPNPFNRTVNIIGLSRPGGDPDVLPLISQWDSQLAHLGDNADAIPKTNQSSESNLDNAKMNSTSNSTRIRAVLYSLKKLQDWTDSIATELNTTIPKFNWTRYIEELFTGLDNVTLNLTDPNTVQIAIRELYLDYVKDTMETIYTYYKTVQRLETRLTDEVNSTLLQYADLESFRSRSNRTRERLCTQITIASFGMAISYSYAAKEKYTTAKTEVRKMFEHIRESFSRILKQVSWMDEITRQRALKKLYSLRSLIGYPSAIKKTSILNDFYKDAQITDNFLDTMVSKVQKQVTKRLNTLNQVNDLNEDDFTITPMEVNAFYDPAKNAIIIPAGILDRPFFTGSLGAVDYGAIGSIVGHEMTHGFDTQGRHYNYVGDLEEWWQPDTSNTYREKAKCFAKAYGNYSITQNGITQQGNSSATLNEDISDNGGFNEALFGYRKCVSVNGEEPLLPQFENYTHDQLLTLSFANLWCENPKPYLSILSEYSDHSPNGVRVNGVLRNSKEFAEIWKCPKGSKMNPSDEKCSLW